MEVGTLIQIPSMKVTLLSDLNSSLLLLTCRKENLLILAKDWAQLLADYPIFCDLWSDFTEAKGQLLNWLLELDRQGEMAYGSPAPVPRSDRYIILFCQRYFSKSSEFRRAVIIHELGHFYIYHKKFLEQLRKSRESSRPVFTQFIAPILTVYQKWPLFQKEWIKNILFDINVLDILKIPGEIFANLWVKENFEQIFIQVFEGQLEGYKLAQRGKERIRGTLGWRALIKFLMFSLILRLDGLSVLVEDDYGKLRGPMEELREFRESCWKTLQEFARQGEFETLKIFEDRIIKASCSLKDSNELLPNIFKEFVNNVPLRIEDFTS